MTRFGDESEVEERAHLASRSNYQLLGWEWRVDGGSGLDREKAALMRLKTTQIITGAQRLPETVWSSSRLSHTVSLEKWADTDAWSAPMQLSKVNCWTARQAKEGKQRQYGLGCWNDDCLGMLSEDHDEWTFAWHYSCHQWRICFYITPWCSDSFHILGGMTSEIWPCILDHCVEEWGIWYLNELLIRKQIQRSWVQRD